MKIHTLVIPVKAPNKLSAKKVAHLVDRLIAIGLDDADESSKLGDAKDSGCDEALSLEIGQCDPTVFPAKK
jgi:hypothetical protein